MKNKLFLLFTILISNLFISTISYAENATQEVEAILALKTAPEGIVFEIVTGASNSLQWALPKTQQLIKKLHARFPKLDIAIVTHGDEQFALQKSNHNKFKEVHALTQQLVQKDNVQLHVCGTYAGRKGIEEEDFPDYVDVAAEGPATIDDYISLGYTLIKI